MPDPFVITFVRAGTPAAKFFVEQSRNQLLTHGSVWLLTDEQWRSLHEDARIVDMNRAQLLKLPPPADA